mmetsp:Transcript_100479/g.283391  ORF Transcript_100479/g.283391 Transcript_100479/m.283391 type:complete len:204 (-) Transcript_100479:174-785(-)
MATSTRRRAQHNAVVTAARACGTNCCIAPPCTRVDQAMPAPFRGAAPSSGAARRPASRERYKWADPQSRADASHQRMRSPASPSVHRKEPTASQSLPRNPSVRPCQKESNARGEQFVIPLPAFRRQANLFRNRSPPRPRPPTPAGPVRHPVRHRPIRQTHWAVAAPDNQCCVAQIHHPFGIAGVPSRRPPQPVQARRARNSHA